MLSKIKYVLFVCMCSLAMLPVWAKDVVLLGTTERLVSITREMPVSESQSHKKIKLLDYQLSAHARDKIKQKLRKNLSNHSLSGAFKAPKAMQLGMNHIPVFDQGLHGTCATFAMTAALDAARDKGNDISQLCLLQLGNQLELSKDEDSGWDGLSLEDAFNRVATYGVMNLNNQRLYGCGGVRLYPRYWISSDAPMPIDEYRAQSEKIFGKEVSWRLLFDKFPEEETYQTSLDVKVAIDNGHRVVFGALLPQSDLGTAGAIGRHHFANDTWVLTDAMLQELHENHDISGHGMVITGYDDTAKAVDSYGNTHQGLFTVRNSWGAYVGDWGDFYMSYDYFDALAMEGYEVITL